MQFILIAYDGTDPQALERRLKVREEHLKRIEQLKKAGEFLFGGAILDESLKNEPYIKGGVWEIIEIKPFRMAKID